MIIITPYAVQPAFNEIIVVDNRSTALVVSEVEPGQGRSVVFRRVIRNDRAVFNIQSFVSKLFYDKTTGISTANVSGWVVKDYRLYVKYKVGDIEYTAINAVRNRGENLNLLDSGKSGALTNRGIINSKITIHKYPGFPVGVTCMYKNMYKDF